ncbi:Tn3 family transposase [Streptosporangium sp. CA-135522]|uniref:Tn3 family transposase n=1 Tax=Streptosporangium sp. CA-135522 TaxID=3240072 RepID=UPI003D8C980C
MVRATPHRGGRLDHPALVRKPSGAAAAIEQAKQELHQALADLEATLADSSPGDVGAVRLDEEGRLVIPPLSAEDVPAEAKELRGELANMLPFVPISALLIELDGRTGFLDAFTPAGGHKTSRSTDLKRNLLAVLLAGGTNLGLTRMAEACGVSYDVLAWIQEWYLREDTLREANNRIVNHHHGLDLSQVFGGGTMSSSDGQRIRDLGKITLVRDDTPTATCARYPRAGPLLGARWNEDLVAGCWDDLLRVAGSLKYGQTTASLIVGKWSAASRQNIPAAALKEWGTLRRTIHAVRYLSDPVYRRKISRQLNKGESLHALRRDLHYAQQGTITRRPHHQDQTEQAWCLTLLTNAVVAWTTEYYSRAVLELRAQGRDVPDELLSHVSPAGFR